jgi:hypothetical protein
MGLLRKIKYLQTLAIYIYICLEPSLRALSKSRNCFPIFDTQFPELLAKVRGGSNSNDNSDEQLLSIRASLVKSESTIAFVSLRASSRCFRFVDPTSGSLPIDQFLLGSSKLRLLRWAIYIVLQVFSSFLSRVTTPLSLHSLFPTAPLPAHGGNGGPHPSSVGVAAERPPPRGRGWKLPRGGVNRRNLKFIALTRPLFPRLVVRTRWTIIEV